jgi:NADH-quinone oxidoreductase subunit J
LTELLLFILFGGITLIGSLLVIFQRSPLHSALFLILTFLSLAGLYLLLGAEFVALIQVIVYAGAVMVLFLFVIMLLNLDTEKRDWMTKQVAQKFLGFFIVAVLVILIVLGITTPLFYGKPQLGARELSSLQGRGVASNTVSVAALLFSDYLLPFEITSVLLLVAMVGVVYLARRVHKKPPSGEKI